MFHIGQRVVCVDDSFPLIGKSVGGFRITDNTGGLTKGVVYTVSHIDASIIDGKPVLMLCEICRSGFEPGYYASRFRPVDETRLEVFRQMLVTPPRERETA